MNKLEQGATRRFASVGAVVVLEFKATSAAKGYAVPDVIRWDQFCAVLVIS